MTGLWSILLLPFFVADKMLFPYITGKNFAFRVIVQIIFALWAYLAVSEPKYRPRFSLIALSAGLFVFIMALADISAVYPMKAIWGNYERMDGFITVLHLAMYFFVAGAVLNTEKLWLCFFKSSAAAGAAMVSLLAWEWLNTAGDRVSATLGNPIYAAVYLLFNFFFALLLLHRELIKSGDSPEPAKAFFTSWLTYLYSLAAAACVFGIWRTSTRGVILGLLGGLGAASLIISVLEKKNRLMRNFFLGILLALAALSAGFIANRNAAFVQNDGTLRRLAGISWTQGYGLTKRHLWLAALKGFREKPVLGWGQEGFSNVFNKYYDAGSYNGEQWFDRAHNTLLDVLVAGGLLGLSAYLSIFIAAAVVIVRKRNKFRAAEIGLLSGLLAAYLFQGLFVFDHLSGSIFLFAVFAYLHSRDTREGPAAGGKIPPGAASRAAAPALAAIFIPMLWYCGLKPIKANMDLVKAMDALSGRDRDPALALNYFRKVFSADTFGNYEAREQIMNLAPAVRNSGGTEPKVKEEFMELARAQALAQVERTPYDARSQYFTGVFFSDQDQFEAALPYLQKAVQLSPENLPMLLALTKCYSYLGQFEKALETSGYAYYLNPGYNAGKKNYVKALRLNGKDLQARDLR